MATVKIKCIEDDGAKISYIRGTKGVQIVSINYTDPEGTYTIPDLIKSSPVMYFKKGFAESLCVKTLKFPETENSLILDEECFENCNSIKTVIISSSISYIPKRCFYNSLIENVEFSAPSRSIEISSQAFSEMKNLINFTWPAGCKQIPDMCFYDSGLKEISGISNVTKIGSSAFSYCNLTKIHWPDSCDTIPEWCFSSSSIEEIVNISHVTNIGGRAFYQCSGLEKFSWPQGCLKVPEECFDSSGLCSIDFGDIHLVSIEKKAFQGTRFKTFKVPETSNLIHTSAFDYMKQLEKIEFVYAESQTTLPANMFSNCPSLKKIIFNASTIKIGEARMFFYLNSRRDLLAAVLDMKNVSEIIVQRNENLNTFLEKIQMGFDTNISIVSHNPEI